MTTKHFPGIAFCSDMFNGATTINRGIINHDDPSFWVMAETSTANPAIWRQGSDLWPQGHHNLSSVSADSIA